jgi:uncharacterized protein YbaR (Trm112 family)
MVIASIGARRIYTLNKMQQSLMDANALRLLACPACHASLTSFDAETVLCTGCGRRYPIRDGLPVLLVRIADS